MLKNQARHLWVAGCSIITLLGAQVAPALALRPDDPFVEQWGYEQTNVFAAWDITTGSKDVVVAVIDNGFDMYHPDLYDNTWRNEREIPDNGIDDDHNGYVDDYWGWNFAAEDANHDGVVDDKEAWGNNDPRPSVVVGGTVDPSLNEAVNHGTLVAGLIGAVGNNGEEGAGINWRVRLINVRVAGNGGVGDIRNLDRAIHYAVDNGAQVINMSLVSDEKPGSVEAVDYAYQHGVVVVAAVGNDRVFLDQIPRFPACADQGSDIQEILGVSAVDVTRHFAQFSNYGSCVDITGPGIDVSSTMRYAPQYGLNQKYGGGWQGTSFAAPFITGTAALIKSVRPDLSPKDVYSIILSSYRKPPPTDPTERKEYQMLFGAGFIQIDKAVKAALAMPQAHSGITRIDFLSPTLGKVSVDPHTGNFGTISSAVLPTQVIDVAGYGSASHRYTAVVSKEKKYNAVTIFSSRDVPDATFRVPIAGKLFLTLADVTGDQIPEVIVTPAGRSNEQYRVYSLAGKLLSVYRDPKPHTHVFLGSGKGTNGEDEIIVADRDTSRLILKTYLGKNRTTTTLQTSLTYRAPQVVHADINGNGELFFVVAGGVGDTPTISFLDEVGVVDHQVLAYDSASKQNFQMISGDVDGDGQADIITAPRTSEQPVRVWKSSGKKIAEWRPYGESGYTMLWVFPVPQTVVPIATQ